jgi:hypothetical protein
MKLLCDAHASSRVPVLAREVAAKPGLGDDCREEPVGDLVVQQPLAFFENVVASKARASIGRSKNHLNSRS